MYDELLYLCFSIDELFLQITNTFYLILYLVELISKISPFSSGIQSKTSTQCHRTSYIQKHGCEDSPCPPRQLYVPDSGQGH